MKESEIITPRGTIPTLTRTIGILWICYGTVAGLFGLYWVWENGYSQFPPSELLMQLLKSILGVMLFAIPFSMPGLLLAGMFPSVHVTNHGIAYQAPFLRGFIHWNEIETIARVKWPIECLAIVFSRRYIPLSNLWFSALYGRIVGVEKPVILLTLLWEDRDELLIRIRANQSYSA